jgi:hypoxanthine phosphoribosyltransferase
MKKINGLYFEEFLSPDQIKSRVAEISKQVNLEFENKNPVLIGILNGSFMFLSDLFKNLEIDCELSFLKVKSYENIESTGEIKQLIGLNHDINNRNIIIVEDIVDTGLTLKFILEELLKFNPLSISVITLLHKPSALKYKVPINIVGFEIENKFVVGYGLDYDGFGRNSKEILVLSKTQG